MQGIAEQDRSHRWRFLREALMGTHQDFTEGSLTRGIALLAVPTVLEMAMESTFGIVDAFWVARLGSDAMAAVGLTEALVVLIFSIALGLSMAAILTRILRASLLEVTRADYVRTARAKGLSERVVWLKHTLRNALLSVITIMSLQFGSLLAGSIITETVFAWPGIGRLTVQAIQTRDYPLVQGCVLVIAVSYIAVNFLTDIFYKLVDPRISYEA